MVFEDIELTLEHLDEWVKPRSVPKPNLLLWGMDSMEMYPQPYGVMTIIVPWNYPIQLSLVPLVGAIAAGNCVIIKPSEIAPHTEKILAELVPKYLDTSAFQVVTGGVSETTELLSHKFDHILYTGSTAVGKIVMRAAANHLTPVTLELGGKSPCIIDATADMYVAARRVAFGKLINSGQSCIAPDYVLIDKSVEQKFIDQYKIVVKTMLGENPQKSDSYSRIINERHFDRIVKLMEKGEIVAGGETDKSELYIAPTVIRNVELSDPVMQEEIFGPVLPLITFQSIDDALDIINDREKPLALYLFSANKKTVNYVKDNTSSGAFTVNDTMTHAACNTLPFGGVGPSGIGGYHGKHSFDAFSHMKPCLNKYPGLEKLNDVRVAPYDQRKLSTVLWFLGYPTSLKKPFAWGKLAKFIGISLVVAMLAIVAKRAYS